MTDTSYQMEGGELVAYDDPFKNITPQMARVAEAIEQDILMCASQISANFLEMGRLLSGFEEEKLYRALGYESFKLWANSPNLHGIGYRTARNLIRIYREALPLLVKHGKADLIPFLPTSKMQALLPILADENAEDKFIEAAYQIHDKTMADSYEIIKEIRGKQDDGMLPTVFSARVIRGESYHKVKITALTGDDIYDCGVLTIKPRDFPRFEERFGRFLEIVSG